MTFEDAIKTTGWGTYHRGVIAVCGMGFLAEGAAVMNIYFTLPLSGCTFHITESHVLWLQTMYAAEVCTAVTSVAGLLIGGFIFSSMSDTIGRRASITTSNIMLFMGLLGSSFSATPAMIGIFVLFLAMGAGSYSAMCRVYTAEILPQDKRASRLVLLDLFWSVGHLINVGIYTVMVPRIMEHAAISSRLKFYTWRMLFALVGTFSLMVACCLAFLGVSPRHLLAMQRGPEAEGVLKQMYTINNNKHSSTFKPPNLEGSVNESSVQYRAIVCSDHMSHICQGHVHYTKALFQKKYLRRTLLCIVVSTCLLFGMSVITMWLSSLLKISEVNEGNVNRECHLGSRTFLLVRHLHENKSDGILCQYHSQHPMNYVSILGGLVVLGRLVLVLVIEHVKRTTALVSLLAISCACSCMMPFFELHILRTCLAGAFTFCYTAAEAIFSVIVVEIFPTAIRGTAVGLIPLFGHLCMVIVLRLMWTTCIILLGILSACLFVATVASFFLPDKSKKPMEE